MKCMVTTTSFSAFILLGLLFFSGCKKNMDSKPELRYVWVHPGLFSLNQDRAFMQKDSLFSLYNEVGINNLFCYNTLPVEDSLGWEVTDIRPMIIGSGKPALLGADTNNTQLFRDYIRKAITVSGDKCKVYPGIGVHTSHNDITMELIVREVEIASEEETKGMIFFPGNSFNKEMMDVLNSSVFSENKALPVRT